jgi:uncharacterized membrane protein
MTEQPSISTLALAYLAALAAVAVLDGAWLGLVATQLYKTEMADLMNQSPRIVPAALFYLLYPVGLVVLLTSGSLPAGAGAALLRGAVIGLMAYGAYDLTNLSVIRGFSSKLSVIDMCWGTVLTAMAMLAAYWTVVARSGR